MPPYRAVFPGARVVRGLVAALLAGVGGLARASDLETCRLLRQQRDGLASRAMEEEIALVRTYRARICPALAAQAEGANARDQHYAPIDFAAWSRCRLEAERQLERTQSLRYRNRQGFTFYTRKGAALAGQADQRSEAIKAQGCLFL